MKPALEDLIRDPLAAVKLAELVLDMNMITDKGLVARRLAREVLGIANHGRAPCLVPITTNGTTRMVPADEPVFLIRGQDAAGGDAVRAWADLAQSRGAEAPIIAVAREHANRMDAWPKKMAPDLPVAA